MSFICVISPRQVPRTFNIKIYITACPLQESYTHTHAHTDARTRTHAHTHTYHTRTHTHIHTLGSSLMWHESSNCSNGYSLLDIISISQWTRAQMHHTIGLKFQLMKDLFNIKSIKSLVHLYH